MLKPYAVRTGSQMCAVMASSARMAVRKALRLWETQYGGSMPLGKVIETASDEYPDDHCYFHTEKALVDAGYTFEYLNQSRHPSATMRH